MLKENDTILIQELTESYRRQLELYCQLRDLVRKILSRMILSRGDISGVISGLEKKKGLLESIESQRRQSASLVEQWQSRKCDLGADPGAENLNAVLEETGLAIREFLDEEEQLKKYLEGIINKNADLPGP